ncbi:efflux transporter outer membrane subunit [Varunaivibrio sulfuroxidans]|uniref:NodT family efflux transporter outer membrane factor (OMF) lipoprotein n=1 Tax=Varunaivibrio sulfuroxidans TaxID=1773489 RepID=A0A4R3JI26_9PROT|nr:efflux transporter outer membrane subunit [Varunaivibrio sulfuroxidans]TCS65175.1 NodT family efflux transporter outer membrane factor (OMF) lipoprotein [Varunaivibrio sulfuroxidans]WES29543.1 efflux transporter outer membrane subunit [Varunaivibrio sulfuroxidans]
MRLFPFISPLLLAVVACAQIPDLTLPHLDLPSEWANARDGETTKAAPTPVVASTWWTAFDSPELNALEQAALTANTDLRAAVARIEQAQGELAIAGGPLLPGITAGLSTQTTRRTTTATSSASGGARISHSSQGSLSASYEVDFWGGNRAAVVAANANLAASRFDRDTVALTLTSSVATTWFKALALTDRVAVARKNLAIARQTLALAEKRESFGQTSTLEAAQQRSSVALIEAQLPALDIQRRQAINALAILTGVPPARLHLKRVTLDGLSVPTLAPALPADLLRRRPDIAKAEANLVAANANIGVARADLYPKLTLTAEGGRLSTAARTLLDPGNLFWTLSGSFAATLFDNGRLQGRVALSEAKKRELMDAYRGAVLNALLDTENALAAIHGLAAQEAADRRAITAAREAERLATVQYREGAVDYLTELEAQRTLLNAEDDAVQVRQARLAAAVSLYKALGGGFSHAAAASKNP